MPVYTYHCGVCGHDISLNRPIDRRDDIVLCQKVDERGERCIGAPRRVVSAPQVVVPTQHRAAK